METRDLAWNKVISRRFNTLLPKSINGLIVGKSGCGKTTLLLHFYLDRSGSITITCTYSEKSLFQPEYRILQKAFKGNLPKSVF